MSITEEFYEELYTSKAPPQIKSKITNVGSEEIPTIEIDEIKKALSKMKLNRASGEDQVTPDLIKYGGEILIKKLKILLNKCLDLY